MSKRSPRGKRPHDGPSRERGEREGGQERARRRRGRPERSRPTGPKHDGRVLVGRSFVKEGLTAGTVDNLHIDASLAPKLGELVALAEERGIAIVRSSRDELDHLADDTRHQGVVAVGPPYREHSLEELLEGLDAPFLVALDEISDPHNFGAILRSALAFGADGVIAPKHRSAPLTPVVVRASAGATERIRIARVTNLQRTLADLDDRGLQVVGLAGEGEWPLHDVPDSETGRVVVVGSEGSGLRRMVRERCTLLAHIPQAGPVESLNASVATGIALYALGPSARKS